MEIKLQYVKAYAKGSGSLDEEDFEQIKERIKNVLNEALIKPNKVVEVVIQDSNSPGRVEVITYFYDLIKQQKVAESVYPAVVNACWNMQYAIKFQSDFESLNVPPLM